MYNRFDTRHLQQLANNICWNRRRLEPFRRNRFEHLALYAGARYSWSAAPRSQPVNLLYLATNIYLRQLVSHDPRVMATPYDQNLVPVAKDFEAWMERAARGMRLTKTLRAVAQNALFLMGICKVGVEHVDTLQINETTHLVGQPYAESIDFDDWVHDVDATKYEACRLSGHRYVVDLQSAKEDPLFDKKVRESLQALPNRLYNEMGDLRVSTLGGGTYGYSDDDFENQVELWDIWLPREKLVVTVPYQESATGGSMLSEKPLRVIEWEGPAQGPYHVLQFAELPNNVTPPAPLQSLVEMHEAVNSMWRKLLRQARRFKKIHVYGGAAEKDMENVNRASDGDAVKGDFFKDRITEVAMGNVDQQLFAFAEQARQITSWLAGNLDTQGGLSPQAQTLGQEELLSKSSSAQVAEMQDRTWSFVNDVVRDIGQYWWENPLLYYTANRQVAGRNIPVEITPQMRQTPFELLNLGIDSYSMQHETPASRLSGFLQLLNQVLMPMMPMLQSQGYSLKADTILEVLGRYGNYPDLPNVLQKGPPPDQQGGAEIAGNAKDVAMKPPVTTRNTVRTNRPGMTDAGHSKVLQQLAMGSNLQPGQRTGIQ